MSRRQTDNGADSPPPRRPTPRESARALLTDNGVVRALAFPIEEALTAPLADLAQSTADINALRAGMTGSARRPFARDHEEDAAPGGSLPRIYAGLSGVLFLLCRALDRVASAGLKIGTHVTSAALLLGQQKSWLFFEARHTAALGQDLVADGRLLLGAKAGFLLGRVFAVYGRRLKEGTPAQRLAAVGAFSNVDALRFKLLTVAKKTAAATEAEKGELQETLAQEKDAAAFDRAAALLEQGQRPDLETLQRALRHADRLGDKGVGLVPDPYL